MELTTKQIQQIEHYLDVKKILQVDLRMEVFDHIMSDIERLITEENSFQEAFAMVRIIWQKHFKETNSFYFGIAYAAPKIVLKKAKNIYKKWFLIYFAALIIPHILIENIPVSISENFKENLTLFLQGTSIFLFLTLLFLVFKKYKSKEKTTYSFVLKTQVWNLIYLPIMLLKFNFLDENRLLDSFNIGLFSVLVFSTYSYYIFLKKHTEIIKKYKTQ